MGEKAPGFGGSVSGIYFPNSRDCLQYIPSRVLNLCPLGRISLLLFFLLTFLFPVTLYCTVLAGINRRPRPLIVPGTWDGVALVLACSGFLLAAGPAILHSFYAGTSRAIILQPGDGAFDWLLEIWSEWWILWAIYYSIIVLWAILLLWSRRSTTVLYNIEPKVFDSVWAATMDQCQLLWARTGNIFFIRKAPAGIRQASSGNHEIILAPKAPATIPDPMGNTAVGPNRHQLAMKIDVFPIFCNISLHWSNQAEHLRQEIENELTKNLSEAITEENPAANWLLGAAIGLFGLMVFCLAVMYMSLSRMGGS
jgi:hypothetical protein